MIWNWRQRRPRLLLGVAIVACGLAVVRPAAAHAGYPLASAARVALGFGATYHAADATSSSTHRGADLSAEAGDRVLAPFSGRVTFAGRVPAVGGGTVRAATLQTAQGAVTLLPLSSLSVAKGDELAEGDSVGTLAEGGDGSSAGTHLHVGVKRGDLYVDPMALLALPAVAPSEGSGEGAEGGAHAGGTASAVGASASHAAVGSGASGVRVGRGVTLGGTARASASSDARATLRAAVPGAQLAPGVSVAGAAVGAQAGAALALHDARAAGLGGAAGAPLATSVARASSVAASQLTVRELAARIARLVSSGARVLGMVLLGAMAGLGLLWPLWRREGQKGTGEDPVSLAGEDVAAVVGR